MIYKFLLVVFGSRIVGEGNGNPLQYSCLEKPVDREACQATILGIAKSWTRLSDYHSFTHLVFFSLLCTRGLINERI